MTNLILHVVLHNGKSHQFIGSNPVPELGGGLNWNGLILDEMVEWSRCKFLLAKGQAMH